MGLISDPQSLPGPYLVPYLDQKPALADFVGFQKKGYLLGQGYRLDVELSAPCNSRGFQFGFRQTEKRSFDHINLLVKKEYRQAPLKKAGRIP